MRSRRDAWGRASLQRLMCKLDATAPQGPRAHQCRPSAASCSGARCEPSKCLWTSPKPARRKDSCGRCVRPPRPHMNRPARHNRCADRDRRSRHRAPGPRTDVKQAPNPRDPGGRVLAKRDEDEVLPDRDFVGGVEQEVIGQAGLGVPCHSNSPMW